MRAEYAFVAEGADVQSGLFYVVRGGTDIWYTASHVSFPVAIGPMSFVVRLVGQPGEVGLPTPVTFTIVDADGRSIGVEGSGEITFSPHPIDRTRSGGALMHFRMGFQVPAPGAYLFELHSGDARLCQVPFWVVEGPPGQPAEEP
ncbi:MAG: DUF6941 family protein [Actinomycetota bacterium]